MIVPAEIAHASAEFNLPGLQKLADSRGISVAESVKQDIQAADEAFVWLIDGEVGCIFGVTRINLVGTAYMWLFPTSKVRERPKEFLRHCFKFRGPFLKKYPLITGYCNIDFEASRKWLRWLGAEFDPPVIINSLRLSRFYIHDEPGLLA